MRFKQGIRGAAALAVAAPLALGSTAFAQGNPHGTPPGQAKADGEPAATPAAPQTAPATPPAKPDKPAKPARPAKRIKAAPVPKAEPAPSATPGGAATAPGHHKVTICHATGSATNPYVTITIPPPAVRAHQRHQDGRDLVPAPAGGCPAAAAAPAKAAAPATATPQAPARTARPAAPAAPSLAALGTRLGQAPAPARSGVLGETARGRVATAEAGAAKPATAAAAATTATPTPGGGLPFTGFDAALAAVIGLAALLAGVALRRSLRPQAA